MTIKNNYRCESFIDRLENYSLSYIIRQLDDGGELTHSDKDSADLWGAAMMLSFDVNEYQWKTNRGDTYPTFKMNACGALEPESAATYALLHKLPTERLNKLNKLLSRYCDLLIRKERNY
jgi:hypothetical protein